jgi:hypothetical protein
MHKKYEFTEGPFIKVKSDTSQQSLSQLLLNKNFHQKNRIYRPVKEEE